VCIALVSVQPCFSSSINNSLILDLHDSATGEERREGGRAIGMGMCWETVDEGVQMIG
jgi:hypothetical protein